MHSSPNKPPSAPQTRRTTYRVPPFADEVVRIHAEHLSQSMGGTRITYTQALVSLLSTAAKTLGIAAPAGTASD